LDVVTRGFVDLRGFHHGVMMFRQRQRIGKQRSTSEWTGRCRRKQSFVRGVEKEVGMWGMPVSRALLQALVDKHGTA